MKWVKGLTIEQDPDDQKDWKFDFAPSTNGTGDSDWLASGETIASHSVSVSPSESPGLTVLKSAITDSSTTVTVWLQSGVIEKSYDVTVSINTNNSPQRKIDRTVKVEISQQ